MTTKDISRIVVVLAVVIFIGMLAVKLISGAVTLVSGLFNTILGILLILGLIALVIWMFAYAKKKKK
ncbi:MAG: hypothetical protein IJJ43_05390 [Oscillospiraceae bacterium]|nr:hypothetical protein [Oscillospiraceae bacterium]